MDSTERDDRAYALQHRNIPVLIATIALPSLCEGSDQATLNGFVTLVRLFMTIEDDFFSLWSRRCFGVGGDSLMAGSRRLDLFLKMTPTFAIGDTQLADITVTQCWLHTLNCQMRERMGVSHAETTRQYVTGSAKGLLSYVSKTRRESLESHGLGMVSLGMSASHLASGGLPLKKKYLFVVFYKTKSVVV